MEQEEKRGNILWAEKGLQLITIAICLLMVKDTREPRSLGAHCYEKAKNRPL